MINDNKTLGELLFDSLYGVDILDRSIERNGWIGTYEDDKATFEAAAKTIQERVMDRVWKAIGICSDTLDDDESGACLRRLQEALKDE
jgi:hypothetical protein